MVEILANISVRKCSQFGPYNFWVTLKFMLVSETNFARMTRFCWLFCSLILIASTTLSAQVRKYSNEFLNIGAGARAHGMSNAVVASVDDNTANYWNPAGLNYIDGNFQVSAMHAEYFAGIAKFDYISFAKNIDEKSTFGLGFLRFGIDDIPNTIDLIDNEGNVNYDRISSFSAADYAFLFSYARKLNVEGLSFGANAKIIYRNIGSFASAWGFGLDAGIQYRKDKWRLAAMGRDITSTYNAWSYTLDERTIEVFQITGNEIPSNGLEITLPKLILGAGRDFAIGEKFGLLTEVNFLNSFDGKRNTAISTDFISIDPSLGLEADYNEMIYLRAGLGNIQRVQAEIGQQLENSLQPNIGLGIRIKRFQLDYALTDIGDQSVALYSNVFSLKIDFEKKETP